MPPIKTAINLYDGVSSPAAKMASILNNVIDAFEGVDKASSRSINVDKLDAARRAAYQFDAEMEDVKDSIGAAGKELDNLNNKLREGQHASSGLKSELTGILKKVGAGFGIKSIIELSDSMTTSVARLDMINDGLQTTKELQDKIFESANRSRASYGATADAVARLGANAGDAFSSTQEIIDFAEQVNKMFTIAGTDSASAAGAMTQLTQALGSGVLRGDELNSIFEASPPLIHAIANEMGVSVGQIRTLASEGKITAQVVKNAMLNAADATNARFNQIPMTFGQLWQKIQNNLLRTFGPLLQAIGSVADWMAEHWGALEPIFVALAIAAGTYAAAMLYVKAATWLAVEANRALIASFLASPITWISVGIAALAYGIKKLADTVGGFGNLWTLVCGYVSAGWNYMVYGILWVGDKLMDGIEAVGMFFFRIGNSIANFFDNLMADILSGIQWLVNGALDALNGLIEGINPFMRGLGLTELVIGKAHFADNAKENAQNRIAARAESYNAYVAGITDARTARAGAMNDVLQKAKNAVPEARAKIAAKNAAKAAEEASPYGNLGDISTGSAGGGGELAAGSVADNIADTAQNTARAADSLESVSMDLSFLRELAERRAVSQYTNANVTLDMSGMQNSFQNDMDVDGFVDVITVKLDEALSASAEGVHW